MDVNDRIRRSVSESLNTLIYYSCNTKLKLHQIIPNKYSHNLLIITIISIFVIELLRFKRRHAGATEWRKGERRAN